MKIEICKLEALVAIGKDRFNKYSEHAFPEPGKFLSNAEFKSLERELQELYGTLLHAEKKLRLCNFNFIQTTIDELRDLLSKGKK